VAKLGNKTT